MTGFGSILFLVLFLVVVILFIFLFVLILENFETILLIGADLFLFVVEVLLGYAELSYSYRLVNKSIFLTLL